MKAASEPIRMATPGPDPIPRSSIGAAGIGGGLVTLPLEACIAIGLL
jgi:hypothetical protein